MFCRPSHESLSCQTGSLIPKLSVLFGVTFVLLKVLQFYWERKKLIKALEAFPGPPKHWLYGHNRLVRIAGPKEYPHAFPRWFGPILPSIIIHHPEYAKTILGRADPKASAFYKLLVPWIGKGLLILEGSKWFQHRKMITPAFHYDVLKSYVTLMSESVKVMLDKWDKRITERRSVELFQDVSLMTLDSLMKCAFSFNSNCQTQRSVPEFPNPGKASAPVPPLILLTPALPLCMLSKFSFREDLGKMTYTTMCIKESLRLFPPVPGVSRELSKPVTFPDGRSLPAGLLSLSILHVAVCDKGTWSLLLPQVFDPLRFSPEKSAQRHSHAFLPFSAGSR
uniref:Uncharacterized protein n=1 Tax=Zonotrichia albicollis TaxID=44394 RepID=A0A8D2QAF0_ZONAL